MAVHPIISKFNRTRDRLANANNGSVQQILKEHIIELIPGLKALAFNGDVNAQYALANSYPKNSSQYNDLMLKASNNGEIRATFALAQSLIEDNPSVREIRKVANLIITINASNNSYVKAEAAELVRSNPRLQKAMQSFESVNTSGAGQFFKPVKAKRPQGLAPRQENTFSA